MTTKFASKILFYRVRSPYGFMSNFSPHSIRLKDEVWPTTEHYFQAQKFAGTHHESDIRRAKSPREAADMGRDRSRPLRADWEKVKDDIMREAVLAKFTQHNDLRSLLIQTGNAELIEHTTNDKYWGDGGNGNGKNMLGKILMEVRNKLKDY